MSSRQETKEAAANYAASEDCDVLLFCGDLDTVAYARLRDLCNSRSVKRKILLALFTLGGDAHAAYKMGRCLHRRYDEVRILVNGRCKSAGTILAISGHHLILSDEGELGPIDVQQMRQDDLWEQSSGLVEGAAIDSLSQTTWDLFERLIAEIKEMSYGRITFKTAADAAAPIVAGTLSPIFAQIDPLKLGETTRALNVATQYAMILNKSSKNLRRQSMAIEKLVTGYPDHAFIIDREEAQTLFHNVGEPDGVLKILSDKLGNLSPSRSVTTYLNDEVPVEEPTEETHDGDAITEGGSEETVGGLPATGDHVANAEENKAAARGNGEAGG